MGGLKERFDVVIVPDFLGPRSRAFEVGSLFFLASWLENAGRARDYPLHLACIGEPPRSVKWLASQCGASITIHSPFEGGGPWNKVRGLEVQGRTERVLLLDVDIIVCGDISGLSQFGYCIAVVPAGKPRVPEPYWGRIYEALGMSPPTERIVSLIGELNCPPGTAETYPGQHAAVNAMTPYYNSGVVFALWDCELRRLWGEHIRTIASLFSEADVAWAALRKSDQAGLATAIEVIKRRGVPFRRLPDDYHAHWVHIYRRALKLSEVKMLHAFGLFRWIGQRRTVGIRREIALFLGKDVYRVVRDLWRQDIEPSQHASVSEHLLPSAREAVQLGLLLDRLYRKYVRPALKH